jgi:hypothetical protein
MSDVTVTAEYTPNPNSMKFTLDRVLLEKRGKTFTKKQDAQGFPLFEKVFDAVGEGILSIFCVNNFFTVTQDGRLHWDEVAPRVEKAVREHFAGGP